MISHRRPRYYAYHARPRAARQEHAAITLEDVTGSSPRKKGITATTTCRLPSLFNLGGCPVRRCQT